MIAASLFVLSRAASYLGVALQYPVYLASGLIVPFAILPAWLGPLSWILAPTWGYRALVHASVGRSAWPQIAMCLAPQRRLRRDRPPVPRLVRAARPRPGQPEALMNWLRVFFHGGLTSYRALFAWLNPWIFLPMLVAYPVFQTVFFVYLGRSAGVANDTFFVIGNSFVAAAITGLFGMGQGIAGERRFQTLSILLASPASRLALFLGRAVPTIVNGFVVALITFAFGAALVGVTIDRSAYAGLALALAVSCFACAALGMCIGSLTFRTRSITVFADAIGGALLARHRRECPTRPPTTSDSEPRELHPTHARNPRRPRTRCRCTHVHRATPDPRRVRRRPRLLHPRLAPAPLLRTRRPQRRLVRTLLNHHRAGHG